MFVGRNILHSSWLYFTVSYVRRLNIPSGVVGACHLTVAYEHFKVWLALYEWKWKWYWFIVFNYNVISCHLFILHIICPLSRYMHDRVHGSAFKVYCILIFLFNVYFSTTSNKVHKICLCFLSATNWIGCVHVAATNREVIDVLHSYNDNAWISSQLAWECLYWGLPLVSLFPFLFNILKFGF